MQVTYIASSNVSTNGVALGAAGQDVRVYGLLIGLPVASGDIQIYNITNPVGDASTNLAAKITLPGSLPTTGADVAVYRSFGPEGLPLNDGGNVQIDATMQVSVIWDVADDSVS